MLERVFDGIAGRPECKPLWRSAVAQAFGAGVTWLALAAPAIAQQSMKVEIPALASIDFAWQAVGSIGSIRRRAWAAGRSGRIPAYPYHGNLDGPGQVTPDIGDTKDPVLKPWAAKQMREFERRSSQRETRLAVRGPDRRAIPAASPDSC